MRAGTAALGLGFLLAAGLFAADFGLAGGNGVAGPALEARVLTAAFLATLFFPARFAAGTERPANLTGALVVRLLALTVFFFVAAFVPAGRARTRFAFTAFLEGAASGFCPAAFAALRAAFAARFASFLASLAAFFSAFLAFFSALRAALSAALLASFASFSSPFDFLPMF